MRCAQHTGIDASPGVTAPLLRFAAPSPPQVLALLWAFLLNAASSIALDVSGLAARHALEFAVDVSLVRAFATFYVVYGTFRVSEM
jgi:hypothetical protein